jgi:hypothetical protein
VPAPEGAVVPTPAGQRRLTARATWLATERISRLASPPGRPRPGWMGGREYGRAVTELARLTSILGQAMTAHELPPEYPEIAEPGGEVVVEFDAGDTERFLVVDRGSP